MRDDEKKKLHENIKQEIRSLLISSPKTKYGGLSGSLLYSDYKQLNSGKEIPYAELGFHSFLSLLRSMPDVVRIEYKENSSSYRIHPVYDKTTAHIQKMVLEQNDKYQYKNQLYNQNWHSNQMTQSNNFLPLNVYNKNDRVKFVHDSFSSYQFNHIQTNSLIPPYHDTNRLLQRSSDTQTFFPSNKSNSASIYEPYFLLTPLEYEKQNETLNNRLSHVPLISNADDHSFSTPNTFIETPHNFDFDDYRLNESIKDISEDDNKICSIDNPINTNDEPVLSTTINITTENLFNLQKDQPITSLSLSSTSDKNISPVIIVSDALECPSNTSEYLVQSSISITDEKKSSSNNEIFFDLNHCIEHEQCKINKLKDRINNAIRECIHFRYIHRLCQIKFEYRYYPLTIQTTLIKSQLENIAFNEYNEELEEFEKRIQFHCLIDDQICETMFNEYVYLQRNYYYMNKLMKTKKTKR